jgi:hypothetical protein
MAYTRTWDNTVSGAQLANTIDTIIANKLVDIQERLEDVLIVSMSAAPVVVKDSVKGKVVGKKRFIPGVFFDSVASDDVGHVNWPNQQGYVTADSVAAPLKAPLNLSPGTTITRIRWLVGNVDAATLSMRLHYKPFTTGAVTVTVDLQTKATSGEEIKDSGTVSYLVADGFYWMEIDKVTGGAGFTLVGVEITFDVPDSRYTQ